MDDVDLRYLKYEHSNIVKLNGAPFSVQNKTEGRMQWKNKVD